MNTINLKEIINSLSNDKCKFYNKGSDTLIIWFGGLGEPFLSDNFVNAVGVDCLSLRDNNSNWYEDGISSYYNSRKKMVIFFDILKIERKYKKIIFSGQSSGGYNALYFFHYNKGDLAIVFAPQTGNQFSGDGHMSPPVKLKNISNLLKKSEKNIIINISRSEKKNEKIYMWNDWWQIRDIRNYENITLITHPFESHATSVFLRDKGIFYKFMKGIIDIYL
ncbi:hypothetical protein [Gluconobacter thailandicus]|uniref:hypothetical protein n=1 Tax=Gluconobacter thailandicus TaxID=257438 RepID=UPI000AB43C75|nr:hypothetical protein [Gluconobacter thailandicus]